MAAVDRAAVAAGLAIDKLMANAGRAVADIVARRVPLGTRIAVLCGPGANGGDGYVAARVLAQRGYPVSVFAERAPSHDPAARAAEGYRGGVAPLAAFDVAQHGLVVDALYGAGLTRPITGDAAQALGALAGGAAVVIAVDVPSGLHADTGQPLGPVARADQTVTFFRLKPAHRLWPGRALCGDVHVADIGLTEAHFAASEVPPLFRNTPGLWPEAWREADPARHKYSRGHVLVMSGDALQTGAARLAASAALHAGAGAVTLAGEREALLIHAAHVTAIMLREAENADALGGLIASGRFSAGVMGPAAGLSGAAEARLAAFLAAPFPLVLDADALTLLGRRAEPFAALREGSPKVLTPHEGEFERLFTPHLLRDAHFAALPGPLAASKIERAAAAARLCGQVVVLKGIDTVIAAPDGRAAINDNAGPELATAGSGDVLAGLIAANLAQGIEPFAAASAGVWLHGHVGARHRVGLTAERLVAAVKPLAAFLPLS
jgi:NAD(P)H-hydrate epimerase